MTRPGKASRSASSPLRTELIITFMGPGCQARSGTHDKLYLPNQRFARYRDG